MSNSQIICCGSLVPEKKGKRICPKCHAEYNVKKPPEPKRTFHKTSSKGYYTFKDSVYHLGVLLRVVSLILSGVGISNIWNNGFSAFHMEGFTTIILMALLGYVIVKASSKRSRS